MILGVWIAAFFTLCIYSFLYKDNPFYKLAEHVYVGVSTGYLVVVTLQEVLVREIWQPFVLYANPETQLSFVGHIVPIIIPTILGVLMFTRFFKHLAWISRVSIAVIVGIGAGIAIPNNVQAQLLRQTEATILPLMGAGLWENITNALVLVGVLTVLFYFFFSVKHEGPLKPVSRIGVFYLMLFFGASFGYTVMGRVSLLIGRMRFLLLDWLGLGGGG